MTKRCGRCRLVKDASEFHRATTKADGLQGYCKPCCAASYREWEERQTPEQMQAGKRRRTLWTNYRMTPQEYDQRYADQGGRCAICGVFKAPYTPEGARAGRHDVLFVDHDHKTRAVRGLLCHGCNTGLGGFRDDPALLRAAVDYVGR